MDRDVVGESFPETEAFREAKRLQPPGPTPLRSYRPEAQSGEGISPLTGPTKAVGGAACTWHPACSARGKAHLKNDPCFREK